VGCPFRKHEWGDLGDGQIVGTVEGNSERLGELREWLRRSYVLGDGHFSIEEVVEIMA
jgi:hypothetical protein